VFPSTIQRLGADVKLRAKFVPLHISEIIWVINRFRAEAVAKPKDGTCCDSLDFPDSDALSSNARFSSVEKRSAHCQESRICDLW
jgi:hypothetical protein